VIKKGESEFRRQINEYQKKAAEIGLIGKSRIQ
jgi:hypothetical protein